MKKQNKQMKQKKPIKRRLYLSIVLAVLLVCIFTTSSFALAIAVAQIRDNRFSMDMGVELYINDGMPIVDSADMIYEPGGTYVSEFPITNLGTYDVWYKVFFTEVEGSLSDYITVTVTEPDGTILCQGTLSELSSDNVEVSSLAAGQKKVLNIEFHFSSDAGNDAQGQTVSFNITANATQKKNNPDQDFGN